MNKKRKIGLLIIAFIAVGVIAWELLQESKRRAESREVVEATEPESEPEIVEEAPIEDPWAIAEVVEAVEEPEPQSMALRTEAVYRFATAEDFGRYLAALRAAGLEPLGGIRRLYAVRLSNGVAAAVDPRAFNGEREDNLHTIRPLPPEAFSPDAFARLRPFAQTASELSSYLPERASGEGILVAVLDTGIDPHLNFQDLRGAWLDYIGGADSDTYSHATSVASIIAGPDGVAPNAILLSVRVLDENGMGNTFDLARGIIEATDLGAKIINMSLGAYGSSPLLESAIQYAFDAGVLLVAAAGNEGLDVLPMPAADPRVIAVTAVDADRQHAIFPNQADGIALAAPGFGIVVPSPEGEILFSGTSAAAPMVSGALAALLSENPTLAPTSALTLMTQNLDEAGAPGVDITYGEGVLSFERIARRDQPNLMDLAVADIYLSPNARPGQSVPVIVTVQNRGTAWVGSATLEVRVGNGPVETFSLGSLDVGAIRSHTVYAFLPAAGSGASLDIIAHVTPPGSRADSDPSNNVLARRFTAPAAN